MTANDAAVAPLDQVLGKEWRVSSSGPGAARPCKRSSTGQVLNSILRRSVLCANTCVDPFSVQLS